MKGTLHFEKKETNKKLCYEEAEDNDIDKSFSTNIDHSLCKGTIWRSPEATRADNNVYPKILQLHQQKCRWRHPHYPTLEGNSRWLCLQLHAWACKFLWNLQLIQHEERKKECHSELIFFGKTVNSSQTLKWEVFIMLSLWHTQIFVCSYKKRLQEYPLRYQWNIVNMLSWAFMSHFCVVALENYIWAGLSEKIRRQKLLAISIRFFDY